MTRITKIWMLIWMTLLPASTFLSAQSFEYFFSGGFFSQIHEATKMTSGRCVLVVQNDSTSGTSFGDSLSIVFLDSTGKFEKSVFVASSIRFQRIDFEWLHVLPNDDFIVGFAIGVCDVGIAPLKLIKYDSSGHVIWAQMNLPIHTPDDIRWSADHSILILEGNQAYSLSDATGEIYWEIPFTSGQFRGGTFTSDSGDILFYDMTGVHFANLDSVAGELQYVIESSGDIAFDADFFNYLQASPWADFYTYSTEYGGIIRLRKNFDIKLLVPLSSDPVALIIDSAGIWVLVNQQDFTYQLSQFDTTGILLNQYGSTLTGIWASDMKKVGQRNVLLGICGSGTFLSDVASQAHIGRVQAWMEHASIEELFVPRDSFNLSITGAAQGEEISIDSIYSSTPWPARYYYTFEGGDFRIQVTNTGSKPVHSFWINTGFNFMHLVSNCGGGANVKQLYYSGLDLQPGESTWVPFGDIYALKQEEYPYEFCFWTSGPNRTPDIFPKDDAYCSSFTVPVTEPEGRSLLIFPNPARDVIHFQTSTPPDVTEWEILNLQGLRLLSGLVSVEGNLQSISIPDLSPGIYIVKIGNLVERVVISL